MLPITFDPNKDAANVAKHGVSLAQAARLEWAGALVGEDTRHNYGERRMLAFAYLGECLMVCVYVDRPEDAPTERRAISLRSANARERKAYDAHQ